MGVSGWLQETVQRARAEYESLSDPIAAYIESKRSPAHNLPRMDGVDRANSRPKESLSAPDADMMEHKRKLEAWMHKA